VQKLIQTLYRLPLKGNYLKIAMENEEKESSLVAENSRESNKVISLGMRCSKPLKSKLCVIV